MMTTPSPSPKYDLDERTYRFARQVAHFCKRLPKTVENLEYSKQVVRSSASVAANYIEANEALGKRDFVMRVKICRKEAKETALFLRLITDINTSDFLSEGQALMAEAGELKKIFSAIVHKCE